MEAERGCALGEQRRAECRRSSIPTADGSDLSGATDGLKVAAELYLPVLLAAVVFHSVFLPVFFCPDVPVKMWRFVQVLAFGLLLLTEASAQSKVRPAW